MIFRSKPDPKPDHRESEAEPFAKGDRVGISPLGAERHPRYAGRTGIVVGLSRYPSVAQVLLEQSKTPVALHKDYLILIKASARRF